MNGTGDPTNPNHPRAIGFKHLHDAIAHLLRVAYLKPDGTWEYPFAEHPRFGFWALNLLQRRSAISKANVYVKQSKVDEEMDVIELLKLLNENKKPPSVLRHLQSWSSKITGTAAYWKNQTK